LVESIRLAKEKNPDKVTNPAQNLEQFYEFIDWASKAMPWRIVKDMPYSTVYDEIYQGITYFYYIIDQPLPYLEGRGYLRNSLQYMEPLRSWLIMFTKDWGKYLSTEESWNNRFYENAKSDDSFGLNRTWYESPDNWKTFNDFFTRRLRTPEERPIDSKEDAALVVAPADSKSQGVFPIDDKAKLVLPVNSKGVLIKSIHLKDVQELLGGHSKYKNSFSNGVFTHMYLDVNDYHRYHFPLEGTVQHMELIQEGDYVGG